MIIVDDGQTIPGELRESFRHQLNITLHSQKQTGPATARNNGASLSNSEFLAFLDDDCWPDADWLHSFTETFQQNPNHCLGGKIGNALPDNVYSTASQLLVDFLYDYFSQNESKISFFTSNNMAISRANFEKLNGFDQSFPLPAAEDRDFCRRWKKEGGELKFVESAQVFHAHHLSWRKFWRQHFNYGRGAFHFHKLRALEESGGIKPEPLSFYRELLLYPFKKKTVPKKARLSFLFLISQIATVSGFFYQKLKNH